MTVDIVFNTIRKLSSIIKAPFGKETTTTKFRRCCNLKTIVYNESAPPADGGHRTLRLKIFLGINLSSLMWTCKRPLSRLIELDGNWRTKQGYIHACFLVSLRAFTTGAGHCLMMKYRFTELCKPSWNREASDDGSSHLSIYWLLMSLVARSCAIFWYAGGTFFFSRNQ